MFCHLQGNPLLKFYLLAFYIIIIIYIYIYIYMYMYMYFFFVLLNKIVQTRWLGVSKILGHFLHFILTSVLLIACSKGYSQTIFYLSIDQTSVYLLLLWLMTVNNVEANL